MTTKQWPLVINLGNSIIGVSVLAMPYCFSQCGIILGILLLLAAAWLTSVSCTLLMKSALVTKRRSFEFLALHSYGGVGKLAVEISSIGLLIGTCVAFYVVIGDLGPAIISKVLNLSNTSTLRTGLLVVVAAFVVTPLGLLRDVQSLNNISAASICFYVFLVTTVIVRAMPNIISGVWINKVLFWNPDGVFKCLPIFAMAFGCQTQLFLMYNALSEPSLNQIVTIVNGAVSLCTGVYLSMGFFGYVAYCDSAIAGDVLMNFIPSALADSLKMGFVLSVAVSFPLVIFPCRASIQTLLFAPRSLHDNVMGGGGFMRVREMHFRTITMIIIICTLCVGIAVPKIEFVLGLTGSTMGSIICFVFPALIFLKVTPVTPDNSRSLAKVVFVLGVLILFVSTYTTIHNSQKEIVVETHQKMVEKSLPEVKKPEVKEPEVKESEVKKPEVKDEVKDNDKRQEPPIPEAPDEEKAKKTKVDPPNDVKSKPDVNSKPVVKTVEKIQDQGNAAINIALNKSVEKTKKEMNENLKKQNKILAQLQEQQKQQKEILKEQKKLLADLKEHDKIHKTNDTSGKLSGQQQGAPLGQQQGAPIGQQQQGAPIGQQQQGAPIGQQQQGAPIGQQQQSAPIGQQQQQGAPLAQQQQVAPVGQQQQGAPIGQQQQVAPIGQQQGAPIGQQQQVAPVGQQQQGAPIGQQQQQGAPIGQQQQGAPVGQQQQQGAPIGQQQQGAPIGQQQQVAPVGQQQEQGAPIGQQQQQDAPIGQQQQQVAPVGQQQQGAPIGQQQQQVAPVGQQQQGAPIAQQQQQQVAPVGQQQQGAPLAQQQQQQVAPVGQQQQGAPLAQQQQQQVAPVGQQQQGAPLAQQQQQQVAPVGQQQQGAPLAQQQQQGSPVGQQQTGGAVIQPQDTAPKVAIQSNPAGDTHDKSLKRKKRSITNRAKNSPQTSKVNADSENLRDSSNTNTGKKQNSPQNGEPPLKLDDVKVDPKRTVVLAANKIANSIDYKLPEDDEDDDVIREKKPIVDDMIISKDKKR